MIPSTKEIKLDGLRSQYKHLSTNAQQLIKQINYTINSVDKNALKNQLNCCYEEMSEIEDDIWEVSAIDEIKNLYKVLVMINEDIIIEAYQVSLMGSLDNDKRITLKEKLLTLQEIPDNPLPGFVHKIITDQRLLNEDKKQILNIWLTEQGWQREAQIAMEKYLMIKVKKDELLSHEYVVTAVLIQSENHLRPECNDYRPILSSLRVANCNKGNLSSAFCELIALC
jgi:Effector-associated domain 9